MHHSLSLLACRAPAQVNLRHWAAGESRKQGLASWWLWVEAGCHSAMTVKETWRQKGRLESAVEAVAWHGCLFSFLGGGRVVCFATQ